MVKTQRKAKQAETLTQDYIITRKLLLAFLSVLHFSYVVLFIVGFESRKGLYYIISYRVDTGTSLMTTSLEFLDFLQK